MASHPLHLFEMPKFKSALNANNSCAFLGHNRKATRGLVNDYNAHPFQIDHIVGCHNGTLYGSSQDRLEKELGEKFPVDSMALIAGIAAFGVEKTITDLEGAWALTWVDLKEGSLNFLRNKDRPLWYAVAEDNKFIFWASEWPTIHAGMRGEYRELKKDKQNCRYFQFSEDYHFKYDISKLLSGKLQKAAAKKVEGKKYVPFVNNCSNYGVHNQSSNPWNRRKTNSTTKSDFDGPAFSTVEGTKDNPYAGYVTESEFEKISMVGCAFCEAPIRFGDKGITIYKDDEILLCPDHSSFADRTKTRIYLSEVPASIAA
jgi:glucosamine 6-phosphate synthetase-like amidotransferase/phosphosugar isomerase protein